jgi:N-acetylmuramoyl-L-alanine amidase
MAVRSVDGSDGSAAVSGDGRGAAAGGPARSPRGAHFAKPDGPDLPWYLSGYTVVTLSLAAVALLALIASNFVGAPAGAHRVGRGGAPGASAPRRAPGAHGTGTALPGAAAKSPPPEAITASTAGGVALDPTLFTSGACVAYPPLRGDRHETVFVDAGHGGVDPGAQGTTTTGRTIYEADETLPVELDLMALLRGAGYRVVVSRTGDDTVARPILGDITPTTQIFTAQGAKNDIAARDVCANLARAALLVGIYFDAGTSPANAGSITAYDATRPFSAHSLRFATLLQGDVLAEMKARGWDIPDDGVQSDVALGGPPLTGAAASYDHLVLLGPADPGYFTTPSQMPGAIIEPLFLTDPAEGSIADSAAGRAAIAIGMAQAVEQYLQGAR